MTASNRIDDERKIRAARGPQITAKGWQTEAALRPALPGFQLRIELQQRAALLVGFGQEDVCVVDDERRAARASDAA